MKKMRLILAAALLCVILPGISQLSRKNIPAEVANKIIDSFVVYPHIFKTNNIKPYDTILYVTYYKNFNVDTIIMRPLYKANDKFIGRFIDSISTFPYINTRTTIYQPDDSPQHLIVVTSTFQLHLPDSLFSLDSIKGIYLTPNGMNPIYAVSDSALYGLGLDKSTDSVYINFAIPELIMIDDYPEYYLLIELKTREDSHYRYAILRNGIKLDMLELKNSDKFGWIWRDFSTTDVPDSCRKED